jgi:nucleotide-binding universal stress UspA family protein
MAIKPIVVGTDGSGQSLRAVDWATREAALRDIPLRIVSVCALEPRTGWFAPSGARCGAIREAAERALREAGDRADMTAHGLTTDTSLLVGQPGPVLLEVAGQAAMLVVGLRGVSGPAAATAPGSVSRYAAVHASCPVVIGRHQSAPVHHQIVVGVRYPDDGEAALDFAFAEASHRGAHLLAVQAWYWSRPRRAEGAAGKPMRVSSEAFVGLGRLLEPWREKYPDVEVGEEVIHARPGRALAEITASADLLVLGRNRGRLAGTDSPLGPVTRAVLEHAHAPVALVPESEHWR